MFRGGQFSFCAYSVNSYALAAGLGTDYGNALWRCVSCKIVSSRCTTTDEACQSPWGFGTRFPKTTHSKPEGTRDEGFSQLRSAYQAGQGGDIHNPRGDPRLILRLRKGLDGLLSQVADYCKEETLRRAPLLERQTFFDSSINEPINVF